ncbi:MAG: translesion error-prone DNA polymerase V autoproteolytic subunit [Pseudomonas sp.]|nr:translesion error-prone DNA polymerase V autoproteolytic subunit [Pseudomonas sp.]MDZ4193806.1 translesion error-prone DNA polymerase V autoproteolytic subunit [Pseudomonas sp.]
MTLILGRLRPSKTLVRMVEARVSAGFPSPAEDYAETYLSLDELVNVRAPSVYLVRAGGDSLNGIGIYDGDVLVVDRAAVANQGEVVIALVDGEFTAKILTYDAADRPVLMAANPHYPPISLQDGEELEVWGVVTDNLHALRRR